MADYKYRVTGPRGGKYLTTTRKEAEKLTRHGGSFRALGQRKASKVKNPGGIHWTRPSRGRFVRLGKVKDSGRVGMGYGKQYGIFMEPDASYGVMAIEAGGYGRNKEAVIGSAPTEHGAMALAKAHSKTRSNPGGRSPAGGWAKQVDGTYLKSGDHESWLVKKEYLNVGMRWALYRRSGRDKMRLQAHYRTLKAAKAATGPIGAAPFLGAGVPRRGGSPVHHPWRNPGPEILWGGGGQGYIKGEIPRSKDLFTIEKAHISAPWVLRLFEDGRAPGRVLDHGYNANKLKKAAQWYVDTVTDHVPMLNKYHNPDTDSWGWGLDWEPIEGDSEAYFADSRVQDDLTYTIRDVGSGWVVEAEVYVPGEGYESEWYGGTHQSKDLAALVAAENETHLMGG